MQTIIHTPTNNLEASLAFYRKLEFKQIADNLFQDGNLTIEVNPDRFARAGVKLKKKSWQTELTELKKVTTVIQKDDIYLFSDPSNVWIYLIESEVAEDNSENSTDTVLGNYAGLSLETTDIAQSSKIWKILGFKNESGDINQGWIALTNDFGAGVSLMKPLMCPHLFFNPSLTFFNGKENNPKVIEKIRQLQIPITEEITHFNPNGEVDNIIIRDPGGYGFFLFNDG